MRPQPILQIIPPLTDDENVFDREQPRGITRRAILERKNALRPHDGIQRASWSNRRPTTPFDSPKNAKNF